MEKIVFSREKKIFESRKQNSYIFKIPQLATLLELENSYNNCQYNFLYNSHILLVKVSQRRVK